MPRHYLRRRVNYLLFLWCILIIVKAILGAHGYKAHETYSPPWTKVKVPEEFLQLICPMAENNLSLVKGITYLFLILNLLNNRVGRENLQGATSYWEMVIILRPYLFQVSFIHK